MLLIDADALNKILGFAKNCKKCKFDKNCINETFSVYGICTALADTLTIGGWISVKDRLPETEGHYLVFYGDSGFLSLGVCDEKDCVYVAYLSQKHRAWWDVEFNKETQNITHWMPLPEAPKETDNAD